uniref:Nuclear cap-binding protein subunit 1 n=1 Tax=Trichuris muris TaxID=70415 RepID=A0A5S6QAL4_TRIMR
MENRKRSGRSQEWGGGKRKRDPTPEKLTLEDVMVQFAGRVHGLPDFDNAAPEVRDKLLKEFEVRELEVKELLTKCILIMPHKITLFSTLVGLMNLKNYSFGSDLADHLISTLTTYLEKRKWEDAQIITIFICSLANCRCISTESCMKILKAFLLVMQQDFKPIQRDLWFSFILRTLPMVGEQLARDVPDALDSLYGDLEKYANSRSSDKYVRLLKVWTSDKPLVQKEYLDCLWSQIQALRTNAWIESYFTRYEKSHSILLSDAVVHSLADFVVPVCFDVIEFPVRSVVFRMFNVGDCPESKGILPPMYSIERFSLEQDIMWLIDKNYTDPKKCAVELSTYYCRGDVPLSYITLEIIFGLMFRLPKPPRIELFYGCLLIELCKAQVYTIPQVVAQATEILFQRLACMNIACIDRFVDWFAFHLSNFRYCWTWNDWTSCCGQEPYSPQQSFVTELLTRCETFSYHERIVDILPGRLKDLLPPAPQVVNKFELDGEPLCELALQVHGAIKARKHPEELLSILSKDGQGNEDGSNFAETVEFKTELLISQLLVVGQKVMSQTMMLLTKYSHVLDQLVRNNENAQLCLLNGIVDAWPNFEQRVAVVVDKLFRLEIVQGPTIIKWIFSEKMKDYFLKQYVWEILFSTFDKLCTNYRVLSDKLSTFAEDTVSPSQGENSPALLELQQGLDACLGAQKAYIFTLFQHFIITLSEHLLAVDEGGDNVSDWYRIVFGRMCQFFTTRCIEIHRYSEELGNVLFTSDLDARITEPYMWFLEFMN